MADQREKARARSKQLTQEIFRRDHKIGELEADLAVHSEALAAIRRDVNRIGEKSIRRRRSWKTASGCWTRSSTRASSSA